MRDSRPWSPRPALLALLLLALSGAASAQDAPSPEDAARLEREAEEARAAAARLKAAAAEQAEEIRRLQLALVEAARERGGRERAALALDERLRTLSGQESALAARVEADRRSLREVFAALARIERARPPAILASSRDALSAARAAMLLSEVAPELEERAGEALDRLDELAALRADIGVQQGALGEAEADLAAQHEQIAALIAARTQEMARLQADSAERSQAAADYASQAQSLRDLLAALQESVEDFTPEASGGRFTNVPSPRLKPEPDERGATPPIIEQPTGRFGDARGRLAPPVTGQVVARYGERTGADTREGMVFRSRRGALVTSPFDARIEYAGPFRGYGRLLILSVGDDYHLVLAGLDAIYGEAGQKVLAGEPIGEMADGPDAVPDLYVEIRKDGVPIDPGPWWRRGG